MRTAKLPVDARITPAAAFVAIATPVATTPGSFLAPMSRPAFAVPSFRESRLH